MEVEYSATLAFKIIGYGPLATRAFPGCASDAPDPAVDKAARRDLIQALVKAVDPEGTDDLSSPWVKAFRGAVVMAPNRVLRKRPPADRLARVFWMSLALQINPAKVGRAMAKEVEAWDDEQCALFNAVTDALEDFDLSGYDE
jgi:hypothetical protein